MDTHKVFLLLEEEENFEQKINLKGDGDVRDGNGDLFCVSLQLLVLQLCLQFLPMPP